MRRKHHATNCDGQIIESVIVAHQTTKTGTFVCSVFWLFWLGCQYQSSAIDWLERLASEMTYYVLMDTDVKPMLTY